VVAPGHNSATGISFSRLDASSGRFQLHADLIGGGNGAAPANDGADALNGPLGPTLNVPVETIEAKHPYLRVDSFRLRLATP
jgi:N-methylhydantoinase B/oxoprolinase/acetone carboxylase alpha subunit